MIKVIHPKIQALRDSVGYSPIYKSRNYEQPDSIRESNSISTDRKLKQYFAIWGVPDDYGTVPIKGCFSKSIEERGPNSKAAYKITALWQHRLIDPLAVPSVLKEDDTGLYGEVSPDEGVQVCDECVIRVRSGTVNNGSYGFNYIWDKMEYDDKTGYILMKECELLEVSFVTIGSQKETYGKRSADGIYTDEFLPEETEDLIKNLPRKYQLEIRSLIDRHISLAKLQPTQSSRKSLKKTKPNNAVINYDFLSQNIKF